MGIVEEIAQLVQKHARNLYPSVSIAQACLESGWGKSELSLKYNNYFGMKGQGVKMKTLEDDGKGNLYEVIDSFRSYPTMEASVIDHERMFDTPFSQEFYREVLAANSPEEQCKALQGTYATDTTYASKLIKIIDDYNLKRYDEKGENNVAIDIEKAIAHMYSLRAKGVRYSMYGSRIGTDGTADCSGAVYSALRVAGASNAGYVLSTETLHDWLLNNGFKRIATNASWEAKRGDVVIFGKKGASAGGAGHVVIFIDHDHIIHCNYNSNGVTVDLESTTCPYRMGWYVYRYAGVKTSAPVKKASFSGPSNIKSANGKVTIAKNATHWLTGEKINPSVLGKAFEYDAIADCQRSGSKKCYRLKSGKDYLGWLIQQDVQQTPPPAEKKAEDREFEINGKKYVVKDA